MTLSYTGLGQLVNDEEAVLKRVAEEKKKGYGEIRRALRRKSPTYMIIVKTTPDLGETRETTTVHTGFLDDALEQADFDFDRAVGFETGSKRTHQVFLTAGNVKVQVPPEFYKDYLISHHYKT